MIQQIMIEYRLRLVGFVIILNIILLVNGKKFYIGMLRVHECFLYIENRVRPFIALRSLILVSKYGILFKKDGVHKHTMLDICLFVKVKWG